MLILPTKKKYFYMIYSGEKREEYREIKPYYSSRLAKLWCENYLCEKYTPEKQKDFFDWIVGRQGIDFGEVLFRNGYSAKSRSFIAECKLNVGYGKPEWGAKDGQLYYVFTIGDIYDRS